MEKENRGRGILFFPFFSTKKRAAVQFNFFCWFPFKFYLLYFFFEAKDIRSWRGVGVGREGLFIFGCCFFSSFFSSTIDKSLSTVFV